MAMKKDSKKISQLEQTLIQCSKKEQELNGLRKKLMIQFMPFFDFRDFEEEFIELDEYLGSLSIEKQTDGFVFVDEMSRNIIVLWVISCIENNGKINYSQFLKFSI